jgi:hypothetical protein
MYVDKNGKEYEHIYCLTEENDGYLPGWYFSDEIGEMHGPFQTLEETEECLKNYCKY